MRIAHQHVLLMAGQHDDRNGIALFWRATDK
jgi:hypothetical protein